MSSEGNCFADLFALLVFVLNSEGAKERGLSSQGGIQIDDASILS